MKKNLLLRIKQLILPFISINLGIILVMFTFALSNGFNNSFLKKIIAIDGSATIKSKNGFINDYKEIENKLKKSKFIDSYCSQLPFNAIINSEKGNIGLKIIGIDDILKVPGIKKNSLKNKNGFIAGVELKKQLNLKIGDKITITTSDDNFELNVSGFFETGLYDYNLNIGYVSLKNAQNITIMPDIVSEIKIFLKNNSNNSIFKKIIKKWPYLTVELWNKKNSTFMNSILIEKKLLWILIILVLLLASFGVYSNLIFHIFQKKRDIKVLHFLGLTTNKIRTIFFIEGVIFSIIACLSGIIFGIVIIESVKKITIPDSVYMISEIPLYININNILEIGIISTLLCIFLSYLSCFIFSKKVIYNKLNYGI